MGMSRQPKPRRLSRIAAAARRVVGAGAGLDRCSDCAHPFMCPMEWDVVGEDHWLIAARCGECGAWREDLVTNGAAKRYDLALARQGAEIANSLRRIDREHMQAELEVLVAAFDHDLIDAADFAR
jgi:hypothetical protein